MLVATGLLVLHAGLLAYASAVDSPTVDEPAHLVAGLNHWTYGRFDLYRVNPPLVRLLASLPGYLIGFNANWTNWSDSPGSRCEFQLGNDFLLANGQHAYRLIVMGRVVCILFSLLAGIVCYAWSSEIHGEQGGLLTLAAWVFLPQAIGHGHLLTPDIAATGLGAAASYCFWHWIRNPTAAAALRAGIGLGISLTAKTTCLVLVPAWVFVWCITRLLRSTQPAQIRTELLQGGLQVCVAIFVVNAIYGFDGCFRRLDAFDFISDGLTVESPQQRMTDAFRGQASRDNRFAGSWIGCIRIPLPEQYVLGIDYQRREFEHCPWPSYLRGEFRDHGWPHYYLYAFAVTIPVGTLALFALAAVRVMSPAIRHPEASLLLLTTPLAVLLLVSSQTGMNQHPRYAFMALPFLIVMAGASLERSSAWGIRGVAIVCLLSSVAESLTVYPHSISYFNALAGGPANGPQHVLGSSVDWGQDLLFVKKWLDQHPQARPFHLSYLGPAVPKEILDVPRLRVG